MPEYLDWFFDPVLSQYVNRGTGAPLAPVGTLGGLMPTNGGAKPMGFNGSTVLPAIVGGVTDLLIPGGGAVTAPITGALLGGGNGTYGGPMVADIPVSGPGVPEPPRQMVAKQWVTKVYANDIGLYFVYFFKLHDGRIMCYNARFKEWKIWRPKKNIVISSDPRISSIVKLERVYNKVIRRLAKKSKGLKLQTATAKTKMVYAGGDDHHHH